MVEQPFAGRAKIDYDGLRLRIAIPSKTNWFVVIFLMAWLGGWFMGESTVLGQLMSGQDNAGDMFLIVWLTMWTIGGVFVFLALLWSLFGQETLEIDNNVFQVGKGLLDFKLFVKRYETRLIHNLELNPVPEVTNFFGQKKIPWNILE
jgi:hypothetical protein